MDIGIKKTDPPVGEAGKKIWYFIIAGIVLIIATAVCVGYFYYSNKNNTVRFAKEDTNNLALSREAKLQEEVAGIIKTNDFNKCQDIEDQTYKTVCVNNIALNLAEEKQDIAYCQKLDNELVSIAGCEKQVLLKKSMNEEDANVCKETKDIKIQKECEENFWPSLAFKKKDINLCDNLAEEQKKISCYDNYLFNDNYLFAEDSAKSKASFNCQRFYSQEVKSDCQNYKNAVLNKKPIVCSSLKSDLFLRYCLFEKRNI